MKELILVFALFASTTACHSTTVEQNEMENPNQESMISLVENKKLNDVKAKLTSGENVNTTDVNGRNLLLIATINKDLEMAKLLVQFKANVNQQADNLDSPFLYAGATGQTEILKLFLENGARFDVFNRYNGSALIPACERGHVETVRLLANTKGYPIDHVNRLGWTALMEAIVLGDGSKKYQEIVQILKDAGSKMDIPDKDGVTPLQHATNRGFVEIVKIIQE
ncbi:ankyrin repeat domain-containing protein [Sphingobacterium daejeonense]|uniref:ankyrin repeat domain-containing protein n=1 Tax=Sphingobacterium daejeonense TaxID=371142 RepID=UPI0021A5E220|nr:ankyrin repeat domain-containing protein [Sphingobacterium daejeonense]MCT1530117.1 ankyrin repeat domain-containing protein [Sphingobacterium daejeonense]